ncbi:hypothetical protein OG195_03015 [Streptomyces sp. NBC_01362]|uniref:hypothetical protein n=1 Tax=Streptomyces sp. NBC_01362 TaxID=2903839 RepID=UPI002E33F00B|nr:hypothetical protein [Streptomyces sp. NBC_01362]
MKGELGVAHVSFRLRPSNRPVEEILHELAETVLPHFPSPGTAAGTDAPGTIAS